MSKYNLELIRGDTLAFGFDIEGITEVDAAYFSVKKSVNETEYIFQKSLNSGIEKVANGKYSVRVAPSDTHDLEIGTYYYDVQIEKNGDVFTVLHGKLKLEADITREKLNALTKGGWYYFVVGTVVAFSFVSENKVNAIAFDFTSDQQHTYDIAPYSISGNKIICDELIFTVNNDVLTLYIEGNAYVAYWNENLDIAFAREIAEEVNNG